MSTIENIYAQIISIDTKIKEHLYMKKKKACDIELTIHPIDKKTVEENVDKMLNEIADIARKYGASIWLQVGYDKEMGWF